MGPTYNSQIKKHWILWASPTDYLLIIDSFTCLFTYVCVLFIYLFFYLYLREEGSMVVQLRDIGWQCISQILILDIPIKRHLSVKSAVWIWSSHFWLDPFPWISFSALWKICSGLIYHADAIVILSNNRQEALAAKRYEDCISQTAQVFAKKCISLLAIQNITSKMYFVFIR